MPPITPAACPSCARAAQANHVSSTSRARVHRLLGSATASHPLVIHALSRARIPLHLRHPSSDTPCEAHTLDTTPRTVANTYGDPERANRFRASGSRGGSTGCSHLARILRCVLSRVVLRGAALRLALAAIGHQPRRHLHELGHQPGVHAAAAAAAYIDQKVRVRVRVRVRVNRDRDI